MPERARTRLESLKTLRDELERVRADAGTLIDRVKTDLERAEEEAAARQRPPESDEDYA